MISRVLLPISILLVAIGSGLLLRTPSPSGVSESRSANLNLPIQSVSPATLREPADETDLLALIDPTRDIVAGKWSKDGGYLSVFPSRFARLRIPYVPTTAYDLEIVAQRTEGDNAIVIGLTRQGRSFAVILDAAKNHRNGFDQLDGKPFYDNQTTVSKAIFQQGSPTTLRCSIRNECVRIYVDGQLLLEWPGDQTRMSLYADWSVGDSGQLFLGAFESAFKITKLVVTHVSK
jgi:hypothetical protein